MEIFGIGMPELVFIVIIALIVLGPKDMQKAGKTIGRWLRDLVTSDGWKIFQQTSRELRTLPNRLMREANEEINKIGKEINAPDPALGDPSSWNTPPLSKPVPPTTPVIKSPPAEKLDTTQVETSQDEPGPND